MHPCTTLFSFHPCAYSNSISRTKEVNVVHQLDKERGIAAEDCKLIKFHTSHCIVELAHYVEVRQRVAATAITYMRRLYSRHNVSMKSMTEYNPCLVAPTCLYLAAKAEESTVHAKLVAFHVTGDLSDEKYFKEIHKMEMKILEALNYYLLVFHPYRSMTHHVAIFGFLQDAGVSDLTEKTMGIINDTYKMDLILVHPPHLIALACMYIASVQDDKEITAWFEELRVDMNVVQSIAMEILDFYDSYKVMSEEPRICAVLNKLR